MDHTNWSIGESYSKYLLLTTKSYARKFDHQGYLPVWLKPNWKKWYGVLNVAFIVNCFISMKHLKITNCSWM